MFNTNETKSWYLKIKLQLVETKHKTQNFKCLNNGTCFTPVF